jgi:GGDEF domain-containing protein
MVFGESDNCSAICTLEYPCTVRCSTSRSRVLRRSSGLPVAADRTIIYIDIDHMHVVNELHGFEVGNELIVRIADLLSPPLLPDGALAARISGDRRKVVAAQGG